MHDYHVKTELALKPGLVAMDLQISSNGFLNCNLGDMRAN